MRVSRAREADAGAVDLDALDPLHIGRERAQTAFGRLHTDPACLARLELREEYQRRLVDELWARRLRRSLDPDALAVDRGFELAPRGFPRLPGPGRPDGFRERQVGTRARQGALSELVDRILHETAHDLVEKAKRGAVGWIRGELPAHDRERVLVLGQDELIVAEVAPELPFPRGLHGGRVDDGQTRRVVAERAGGDIVPEPVPRDIAQILHAAAAQRDAVAGGNEDRDLDARVVEIRDL